MKMQEYKIMIKTEVITRRRFLKACGFFAAAVGTTGCTSELVGLSGKKSESSRPNIVFILADDMGYGDAGCYNSDSKVPTPHIDSLAREAMRFTDAHTPSAVCSPTRYGLLTGRYAWRTVLKKKVLWEWDRPLIEKGRLTVASMLNQYGYDTACIGKWHLGWVWKTAQGKPIPMPLKIGEPRRDLRRTFPETIDFTQPLGGGPLAAGFDSYFGDDVVNQPPYLWIENDRCLSIPTEPLLKSIKKGSTNGPATPGWDQADVLPAIGRRAAGYISKRGKEKDKPFFLYFPLTAPHKPFVPGQAYVGKTGIGDYGDFVHHVDAVVGQISEALDKAGLAENTLVIFTSDNGSVSDPVGGHRPNGALRGKKAKIYEGGHRVPFIARWPGKIKAGSVNDQLVGVNDFLATVAAIVGHKLGDNAAEDSVDILPTLLDGSVPVRRYLVNHSAEGVFAIRDGDWKLIIADDSTEMAWQLYNLADDLAETNNLYEKHPEIVKRLTAKLEQYRQSGRSVKR
jgi:arylsulfatase A-like enzyme